MSEIIICLFGSTRYDRSCQGLAGAGRQLADQLGTSLRAAVIGAGAESLAEQVAGVVDSITVADQPDLAEYQPEQYLTALAELFSSLSPRAVLLSNDSYSQELSPRLAHRLNGSAVGDGIAVTATGDRLRVVRQVYGGKAQATIELKRTPAVIWLRSRSFAAPLPRPVASEITRTTLQVNAGARTRVVERKREESGSVRLEDARVIVSGGRGIGGPEPFTSELLPLADLMGAQVAASRAACDAGWAPPTWQIGQTGKKVAPDLYLAIAIAGASQHMAGISEAKNIVAINTDSDAPIFKHCRFGIVEDYRKVVPLLREKLAALQK
jgi:electron transfer flavoprotein alpha subunit